MTSSIINIVIDKYLSNILEIDPEKTKSSLWSGFVELNNMKIKQELFKQINVPYFEIVDGFVGKLKINLSLPRFWLAPVKVEVEKIYFLVKQKSLDKFDEKKELKNVEAYIQSKLLSIEELVNGVNAMEKEPGMSDQLMKNIQIEVRDIVFRFEDDISYPECPFSFGMTIQKVQIRATGSDFIPKHDELVPEHDKAFMLIDMSGFSAYLDYRKHAKQNSFRQLIDPKVLTDVSDQKEYFKDSFDFFAYCESEMRNYSKDSEAHKYIIFDLNVSLKVTKNDKFAKNGNPALEADLKISKIEMGIGTKQLTVLFKLLAYLGVNTMIRTGCVSKYYRRKLEKDDKLKYMEMYIEYFKFKYKDKYKNDSKAVEEFKKVCRYEHFLTYDQIASMREAALMKLEFMESLDNLDNQISSHQNSWGVSCSLLISLFFWH